MTFICVSIMVEELAPALAEAEDARSAGARMVEWRVDLVADDIALVQRLVRDSPLPCIITCRPLSEGGDYGGDEQSRIALFEHVGLHARPRYLDVELDAFERSANLRQKVKLAIRHPDQWREMDTGLILSTHDFTGRPPDLLQRLERMASEPACEVVKVAWMARSLRDNLEAFELLLARHKPMVALCMGRFGLMSRVLAPKFGGLLTFASLRDESATAPGQPTIDDLRNLYRFDRIGPDTRLYGVVGWPVEHSLSPRFHNDAFERIGFDGVYLPLPVAPEYESFKATIGALIDFTPLHFLGASVTIPHKEHLLRFVRESGGFIDETTRRIGAANTLIVRDDGSLEARNSDAPALVESVAEALWGKRAGLKRAGSSSSPAGAEDGPARWEQLRIAVIGAGGMARAAIGAFAHLGATVVVYARRYERAEALTREFHGRPTAGGGAARVVAARLEKLCDSCCDIFINATPVGMEGGPDPDGLPWRAGPPSQRAGSPSKRAGPSSAPVRLPDGPAGLEDEPARSGDEVCFTPDTLVVDTVYTPPETPLLRFAAGHGARTLSGLDLFRRQAALQFQWWTSTT